MKRLLQVVRSALLDVDTVASRRRRHALRASEARFRALLESAPDAIVIVDQDGRIVLANSEADRLFGYSRQELIGAPVDRLVPEHLRETHTRHRQTYHADPRTRPMGLGIPLAGRRKDGTEFPAEISLSPLATDEGPLVTAVIRDTTERRRAETARAELIREQDARAEAEAAHRRTAFLAEASTVLSASLDDEATLKSVARLVVPYLADWCLIDVVRDGALEPLAVAHLDPERERFARAWFARHPLSADARHGVPNVVRTGKTELWNEIPRPLLQRAAPTAEERAAIEQLGLRAVMIVPLATRDRVLGAITFATAESGRVYGETDRALAEDLSYRIALAVDNARLYREAETARGRAEAANRMKDEFLATISHELRTPLTAILGWVRLLRSPRYTVTPETRGPLETIERNARAQAQLVDDLLDVSRIITGRLRLDVRPTDLGAIVDAALDAVRPAASAKHLAVELSLDPSAATVLGDPDRLQQIVWNLVTNAVKFTPEGGRVTLDVRRSANRAVVVVRDTGKGITAEFLPYIFERFRQEDSTPTRAHGGLGLGLAIVRHLVEMHGGTVHAESGGEGRGSTFTVTLPLAAHDPVWPAPLRASETRGLEAAGADGDAVRLDGCRVLVVDDDVDSRETIAAMLADHGADVMAAPSTASALDVLRETTVDVLVADIAMPGADGYELIRRVRALPAAAGKVQAIALTAYARSEDRGRALGSGYDAHVTKPVDPSALAGIVARVRRN